MTSSISPNRTGDGRFAPGHSGNPAGRPRGSGAGAVARAAMARLDEAAAESLMAGLLEKALAGDGVAMRFCLSRVLPVAKGRYRTLDFGGPEWAGHAEVAYNLTLAAMAKGELAIEDARDVVGMLAAKPRVLAADAKLDAENERQMPDIAPDVVPYCRSMFEPDPWNVGAGAAVPTPAPAPDPARAPAPAGDPDAGDPDAGDPDAGEDEADADSCIPPRDRPDDPPAPGFLDPALDDDDDDDRPLGPAIILPFLPHAPPRPTDSPTPHPDAPPDGRLCDRSRAVRLFFACSAVGSGDKFVEPAGRMSLYRPRVASCRGAQGGRVGGSGVTRDIRVPSDRKADRKVWERGVKP